MDIRSYFWKVRNIESTINTAWVVVISNDTPDGGKAGRAIEVCREVAAQMVADGRARLATEDETAEYYAEMQKLTDAAEQAVNASKVQINVISEANMRSIQRGLKLKD